MKLKNLHKCGFWGGSIWTSIYTRGGEITLKIGLRYCEECGELNKGLVVLRLNYWPDCFRLVTIVFDK